MNFDTTAVLLEETEGPINLGAICRAMANTGFSSLHYTGALQKDHSEALKFAVHAKDLLQGAHKYPDLNEMISHYDVVFGFSPRNPKEDGRGLNLDQFHDVYAASVACGKSIGLLFGNEARGLDNEALARCHWRVSLPTHEKYTSMNLSQAVLVVLWELRRKHGEAIEVAVAQPEFANAKEKEILLENMRNFLDTMDFLNPQNPEHLWLEIIPLIKTREWTKREMTILHAIFSKCGTRYQWLKNKMARLDEAQDSGVENTPPN